MVPYGIHVSWQAAATVRRRWLRCFPARRLSAGRFAGVLQVSAEAVARPGLSAGVLSCDPASPRWPLPSPLGALSLPRDLPGGSGGGRRGAPRVARAESMRSCAVSLAWAAMLLGRAGPPRAGADADREVPCGA